MMTLTDVGYGPGVVEEADECCDGFARNAVDLYDSLGPPMLTWLIYDVLQHR